MHYLCEIFRLALALIRPGSLKGSGDPMVPAKGEGDGQERGALTANKPRSASTMLPRKASVEAYSEIARKSIGYRTT